jgi:hypothetical protein
MSYTQSGEEKDLEPNLAHLRANTLGAEQMRTAGTSKVCIDRLALVCNRAPGFAPNQHYAPPSGLKSIHAAGRRTLVILHECTLRFFQPIGQPLGLKEKTSDAR